MKSIFIKLVAFTLIFVAVDYGFGQIVKKLYLRSNNNMNYGFVKCKDKEVLLFGASEISHGFISNMVADSTGMSCFNLAEDGCGILYQYPLFQTIVSRYKPKAILLSTMQLTAGEAPDYISKMYPYYEDNVYVRNVIDDFNPDESLKLRLRGYAYNSLLFRIGAGSASMKQNGYIPLPVEKKAIDTNPALPKGKNPGTSKEYKMYFDKIIALANKHNIKLYVLIPPKRELVDEGYRKDFHDFFKNKDVELIDLTKDQEFINNPGLYKYNDIVHLNDEGAKKLTSRLIKKLKEDFKTK